MTSSEDYSIETDRQGNDFEILLKLLNFYTFQNSKVSIIIKYRFFLCLHRGTPSEQVSAQLESYLPL